MSVSSTKWFIITLIVVTCVQTSLPYITRVRRPKVMGDKVPIHVLLPQRKPVQRKIVRHHNFFRTIVEPPASNMLKLKWHRGAAYAAQRWADECMFLTHDNITGRHIENYGGCGQNIFVSTHQVPWLFAIKTWFSEKEHFTFGSAHNQLKIIGHYTQMVWATTHEVGCGFSKCRKNNAFSSKTYFNYVCNYCPIGNRPNQLGHPYKSGKPCHGCKNSCYHKKLCTNSCPAADNWANCKDLNSVWPTWLCQTSTSKGRERANNCKATCRCKNQIHD